jgi:hypothetical protein
MTRATNDDDEYDAYAIALCFRETFHAPLMSARHEEWNCSAYGPALVDVREHKNEAGQVEAYADAPDVFEAWQRDDVCSASWPDTIDPIDAHRPHGIAFTSQPEEGNGAERFVAATATGRTDVTVRLVIEPLYLIAADLYHAAMRPKVDKTDRDRNAIRLPRFGGNAINRVAGCIKWSST